MADNREFFKMDVGYFDNPKVQSIIDEHPRAVLLHMRCIAYARQHRTDGVVPLRVVLRSIGDDASGIASGNATYIAARNAGLLLDADGGNTLVHDYAEHQQTAAELKRLSLRQSANARARWDASGTASGDASGTASGNASGNAEKRREEKSVVARKRGNRIPADFVVTDEMREWALRSAPFADVDRATEKFIDYWTAKTGSGATKADWVRTWQNWLRKDSDDTPNWKRQQAPETPARSQVYERDMRPFDGDPDDIDAYREHYRAERERVWRERGEL